MRAYDSTTVILTDAGRAYLRDRKCQPERAETNRRLRPCRPHSPPRPAPAAAAPRPRCRERAA